MNDQPNLFDPDQVTKQRRELAAATAAYRNWQAGGAKATQRQRVLHALNQAGEVCGLYLYAQRMPRYASVIHQLRNDGWPITSHTCAHGGSPVVDYRLTL